MNHEQILEQAGKQTAEMLNRIIDQKNATIAQLEEEVDAYRNGGVTEEILRRQDGSIKVGRGCVIVRSDEYEDMRDELARLKAKIEVDEESHY